MGVSMGEKEDIEKIISCVRKIMGMNEDISKGVKISISGNPPEKRNPNVRWAGKVDWVMNYDRLVTTVCGVTRPRCVMPATSDERNCPYCFKAY
jgi:hypothetical protein